MPTVTLDKLKIADTGKVVRVDGADDVRRRLMEMGLTPGATLRVVRFAPLGDPIDIEVRGYHLSLRKQEAMAVQIDISA